MRSSRQIPLFLILLLGSLIGSWFPAIEAGAQGDGPAIVEDEDVPPGVAAGWIVGHRLLAEGKTADALPYLHQAYRAHPEVVVIAMDFQEALAGEGYLRDALKVMDTLVAAWPDSPVLPVATLGPEPVGRPQGRGPGRSA